jgi:peptidoglycan hydrolase-like protein with peptidoglycan-binding domain
MIRNRLAALLSVLGFAAAAAIGGWVAGSRIKSPADVAARTAAPAPSPILVPVEHRVLSSDIVTRGTARFGLPQPISLAPSTLKPGAGLITTLPVRNAPLREGAVLLTASGRPVFLLQGQVPSYRDLVPGISGPDVIQFEQALARLGFDPGPLDGVYDQQSSAAAAAWYQANRHEPFGPTPDQLVNARTLERNLAEARKLAMAAAGAAAAAGLAVESARATAEHNNRTAAVDLAARTADLSRLAASGNGEGPLAVESARARARRAETAAEADIAARVAERAVIVLDPRQTATARAAADANLELARAAYEQIRLDSELAIQAAERDARLATEQYELAQAAVKSARLAGDMAIRSALDAKKVADLDAQLAEAHVEQLALEFEQLRQKLGVQVPVDEVVFMPSLPVRVEDVTARVGDAARGPVLSVTDNQLVIDSSLPLDSAPLVKPGMQVAVDEEALGIQATGTVALVASTPGTRGVDGFHIYFEVRVDPTPTPLEGFSLRLTIPVESTRGAVRAVPLSAVSLSADGTSRVQVQTDEDVLEYVTVEPGLSANGFVEVTPVDGTLEPGQLVVVGYRTP